MSLITGLLIAAVIVTVLLHLVTYKPLVGYAPDIVAGIHGVPKRLILVVLCGLAAVIVLWLAPRQQEIYTLTGVLISHGGVALILYAVADFFESVIESLRRRLTGGRT